MAPRLVSCQQSRLWIHNCSSWGVESGASATIWTCIHVIRCTNGSWTCVYFRFASDLQINILYTYTVYIYIQYACSCVDLWGWKNSVCNNNYSTTSSSNGENTYSRNTLQRWFRRLQPFLLAQLMSRYIKISSQKLGLARTRRGWLITFGIVFIWNWHLCRITTPYAWVTYTYINI